MSQTPTVLLVGGTGRTGRRVLAQLLERETAVRAIVRSARRLPPELATHPRLTVIEADLLSLPDAALLAQVRGCDVVISCLGHVLSLRGVFGPPHDLVARATRRLCQAASEAHPKVPIKFILMSSVSVNHPGLAEPRRGATEKGLLCVLRWLVPPARDNQRAAGFLYDAVAADDPSVRWVVVRPDTLLEGDVSGYSLHEAVVSGLFKPAKTNMANIADFMGNLATDPPTWTRWEGRMPVIVNDVGADHTRG